MSVIDTELYRGNIVMTRIRLARNLKDFPFKAEPVTAKEIVKKVNRALLKCDTFNLYFTANLDDLTLEAMKEKMLISEALIENRQSGAALINADKSISVMVNEEDVIREQCFMKGLRLSEAYRKIQKIDQELAKNLDLAFDEKLGYLTACPTNLGTGLRASVLLFLPALTEGGKINSLIREVENLGLTVRGAYGEGSAGEGFMYQISNEVTLGVSEEEIINSVEEKVLKICAFERKETERLFGNRELKIIDRVRKSFGILTNAVLLDYKEFLSHVSLVKMGAMLGMIDINDLESIDDLIVAVRPAVLCEQHGKKLSLVDRDLFRAEIVSKKLLKLRG